VCVCECVSLYSKCLERLFGEKPDVERTSPCACVSNTCHQYEYVYYIYILICCGIIDMIENNYQTLSLIYVTCEKLVATNYCSMVDDEKLFKQTVRLISAFCDFSIIIVNKTGSIFVQYKMRPKNYVYYTYYNTRWNKLSIVL